MEVKLTEGQKTILYVLKHFSGIVMSWGVSKVLKIKVGHWDGIRLHVQGFVHEGAVNILYNEGTDLFDIQFIDLNEKIVKTIEDVYIDQLIEILDTNIEKCPNYENFVKQYYNLND